MIDKKEFTKLSPGERIKRLKLLEEEKKKEVDEIGHLIRDSMRELKTDKLAEEVAPEQKAVDISRLFESNAGHNLEWTARKETASSGKGSKGYQTFLQVQYDYTKLKKFEYALSVEGTLTQEQLASIGQIGERINRAERYMTDSEKTASKLDASRIVLYKLKKETGLD
ncbi:hypothetical protein HYX08_02370 [Candidatus Woesearchaeota archaeon]|nr:hypothetical protein [Candidatus Woesearchaeota archaeon]